MFKRFKIGEPVFVEDGLGATAQGLVAELASGKVGIRVGGDEADEIRFVDARLVHR